ncbi:ATP-binding protein [Candidatus Woesearchaeota archaeon]|nr:ATP-binding protein [Candidatus Woesearchaeota archaeon]
MYEIVVGRNEEDRKKYGLQGTILIGKHYVKMGQTTSLSNKIYMDVSRSHVVFICGKRGTGKSYTMGAIAEGVADLPPEINKNLSIIILDTMGIYWTMKYPNKKDKGLLDDWGFEGKGLNVQIFTPTGYYDKYKEAGIPTDFPFSIKTNDLDASDWCMTFGISINDPWGILIERIIETLKENKQDYDIDDIVREIKKDTHSEEKERNAVENRFLSAKKWGLFSKEGTLLKDLVLPGQVTVLDVSCYVTIPGASNLRALVIGLVAEKLFIERMVARKKEELEALEKEMHMFAREDDDEKKEPLVWLVVDEAHEFLPNVGTTTATQPLITILREGRQPGISLVLATQQPGKIHTDVMTQSDVVIAHRITANIDVQALGALMQTYMRAGLDKELNILPRVKGAAIVFDDINEKMYPMRVRPRLTWHGGEAPSAILSKKKVF